jgi:hypothetical protein
LIGPFHQGHRRLAAVLVAQGNADAGSDAHLEVIKKEGCFQADHNAAGQFPADLGVGTVAENRHEFVTPDASQHVPLS